VAKDAILAIFIASINVWNKHPFTNLTASFPGQPGYKLAPDRLNHYRF